MISAFSGCGDKKDSDVKEADKKEPVSKTTESTTEKTTKKYINPNDKLIALTFDDGPYSPVTEKILDTLEENGAVATFFVVGNRVNEYSSSVKRASDMGCEIGSHTYSHKALTRISTDEMKSELSKTNDVVSKITGKEIKTMRPPEGAVNDTVKSTINYPMILWSVDSMDWKYREMNADYNNVVNSVFDGSIVLMHDLYDATADAVAKFVPELVSQGYKFVTVSELAEARGVSLDNGTSYFNISPQEEETTSESTSTTESTYVDIDQIVE